MQVDEEAVSALMELGWSRGEARVGLRAAVGELTAAHDYLERERENRRAARQRDQRQRRDRELGLCADGTPVSRQLVLALEGMGFPRLVAVRALRASGNHVAEAVRLIHEHPETVSVDRSCLPCRASNAYTSRT